ncbi:MAG: hypothetical protein V4689_01195 [Verrucomicrobiota bacterium]
MIALNHLVGGASLVCGFTEDSPGRHHVTTFGCEGPIAMKENIVIPIKIERVKLLTYWTLEATTWLICLGLLAASGAVAGVAALVWLISGSEIILTLGLSSGLVLGLAGVWCLLRKLDRTVNQLRQEMPAA